MNHSEYCPRCDARLEWRGEDQFCVPCDFWWSWTGSSWMGKKNTKVSEKSPKVTKDE